MLILVAVCTMVSCKKEDDLNVDVNDLNPDDPALNTELDAWLQQTFLDPYNAAVVYRYNRYYHDNEKNIAPVKTEMVKPTMETVLNGYINPYYKVAGRDFIKKYIPKEWVLFGSYSYNSDGVVIAGTASAGRRITLYGLNNFRATPSFVAGHLGVIHHEFGHILQSAGGDPHRFSNPFQKEITRPHGPVHPLILPINMASCLLMPVALTLKTMRKPSGLYW